MYTPKPWLSRKYSHDDATIRKMRAAGIEPTPALTNDGSRVVKDTDGNPIAYVLLRDTTVKPKDAHLTDDPEREANTDLIKTAPELLHQLEACLICLLTAYEGKEERISGLVKNVRSVIAKAKGKG